MKKQWMTLVVVMAVAGLAGNADARGRGKGPGMGHEMGRMGPGMLLGLGPCVVESPELGLSDDQKAALKKLREDGREPVEQAKVEKRKLAKELRDLVMDPKATDRQIRAKAAEMRDRAAAMHDARLDRLLQARQVLTAEQLLKVPAIRKECRGPRDGGPRGDCPGDCPRKGPGPRWMDDAEE